MDVIHEAMGGDAEFVEDITKGKEVSDEEKGPQGSDLGGT